jgi:hypothetical protein
MRHPSMTYSATCQNKYIEPFYENNKVFGLRKLSYMKFIIVSGNVRLVQSFVFCVLFCRSLFVLLFFFS